MTRVAAPPVPFVRCTLLLAGILMLTPILPAQTADWAALDAHAHELYDQEKYAEALPIAQRALQIAEGFGPGDPRLRTALSREANILRGMGKYAEAQPLLERAVRLYEQAGEQKTREYANALHDLGFDLFQQSNYKEAAPILEKVTELDKSVTYPADSIDPALHLAMLAKVYGEMGRFGEAVPLFQKAAALFEPAHRTDDPELGSVLADLGLVYLSLAQYENARDTYLRAQGILQKAHKADSRDYSAILTGLAIAYKYLGFYGRAEATYRESIRVDEAALGPDHPDVAAPLHNLAVLYMSEDKYGEAESLLLRSLQIEEKGLGPDHAAVAFICKSIGQLYQNEGRYEDAEKMYRRTLAIWAKNKGAENPDNAPAWLSLASLEKDRGRYAPALEYARKAQELAAKLGKQNAQLAGVLAMVGELEELGGQLPAAETDLQAAVAAYEKSAPRHPLFGGALRLLGDVEARQGKLPEAEALYHRAATLQLETVGRDNTELPPTWTSLGDLYFEEGRVAEARGAYGDALSSVHRRLDSMYMFVNERERLVMMQRVSGLFPRFFSFCLANIGKDPALAGEMYDVVLWQKGFVGNSITALQAKIEASGDPEARDLLERLRAAKTRLATLAAAPGRDREAWKKQLADLEQQTADLERELAKRSAAFRQEQQLKQVTWQDVRTGLRPGEAAVEIVRFHFHNGKSWTERYSYVALIVTPASKQPQLIDLGDAAQLDADAIQRYEASLGRGFATAEPDGKAVPKGAGRTRLYQAVWAPLAAVLGGARRVYLAPDGALNQVAFGPVASPHGHRLIETYDIRVVSSTRDLLRPSPPAQSQVAVLMGNPAFDLTAEQQRVALKQAQVTEAAELVATASTAALATGMSPAVRGSSCQTESSGGLCSLPGTAVEITSIAGLLQRSHWSVAQYMGASALEEVAKSVHHPSILHIATHGFFITDTTSKATGPGLGDPMLRSGLLFAGANRALTGAPPSAELDDGVLTAYEASTLDLEGTELVVLSACDTGLGDVRAGEGVFGLRRAFQVAGAQAVMMSLWSVPDRETQELMTLFYRKWLAGMEKHEALRQAELAERAVVRKRYGRDLPYYWGAFVLVGK